MRSFPAAIRLARCHPRGVTLYRRHAVTLRLDYKTAPQFAVDVRIVSAHACVDSPKDGALNPVLPTAFHL